VSRSLELQLVWIAEDGPLAEILREAKARLPCETGGILMGYRTGPAVVVTDAIGPGPKASHRRTSFAPDYSYQQGEIERIYSASGRRHTYLGDWHTHPGSNTIPCARDSTTLQRIAETPEARSPQPLMAILGYRKRCWSLQIWQYNYGNSPSLTALSLQFYSLAPGRKATSGWQ
jgi:integrative and conjugative element protein (TIGR02256 family)